MKKPSRKTLVQKGRIYKDIATWRNYDNVHHWLVRHYGKANKCENPICSYSNPKIYQWALRFGKEYIKDRNNFWMLCPSCHIKIDATPTKAQKLRLLRLGTKLSIATRNKMSLAGMGRQFSLSSRKQIAEHNGKTSLQARKQIIILCEQGKLTKTDIGKMFRITRQAVGHLFKRKEFYAS